MLPGWLPASGESDSRVLAAHPPCSRALAGDPMTGGRQGQLSSRRLADGICGCEGLPLRQRAEPAKTFAASVSLEWATSWAHRGIDRLESLDAPLCGYSGRTGGARDQRRRLQHPYSPFPGLLQGAPIAGSLTECRPVSIRPAKRRVKALGSSPVTLKSYQPPESFSRQVLSICCPAGTSTTHGAWPR